ncbi:PREDICTED: protein fem-1 homolog CG6966-like, partial [Branchiostoma belcheri]|uniref:Protein fem-1 homolog CG6966-like n=1 Tax=Branchiostoma belcheri TaxID=7741 RepID=A0A6P5A3D0_BRABE
HTEVVELLVHHGATLDIRDAFQRTPLMVACSSKQVDIARRLIEFGARVDLTDVNGLTAQEHCEMDVELTKLIQEALQTGLLRCCNPICGKPGHRSTLQLCAQCKLTRYRNSDCQRQHWTVGHKKCCGHDAYSDDGSNPFLQLAKLTAQVLQDMKM